MTEPRRPSVPRLARELIVLAAIAIVALALRAWVAGVYAIPSPSMLPRMLIGDYVLVAKYPFRLRHRTPERGWIVLVRNPAPGRPDIVKRVVGLPGDTIALRSGQVILNGTPLPRWRVADLLLTDAGDRCPIAPENRARSEPADGGGVACRYPRYREMLPGGTTIDAVDLGRTDRDDVAAVRVPAGHLFLLGDNRDDSADSRVATADGGIGLVPIAAVVGRADLILFSVDGTARLAHPASWLRAIRWHRIGARF